jgi:hypothetical protein
LSDIAALPLAGGTLTGALSLGTNTISSGRITLSTNDQSTNRLTITNSGAGGRSYSIVGGLNGANNSGFSIYDETAGSTRFDINSSGSATFASSVLANNLVIRNAGVPAAQFFRDLDVTVVGPAGQGIEIGARSGSTFIAGGAIYASLFNPATTGDLGDRRS